MNIKKRIEIFKCFKTQMPAPETELIYSTPFELLVAVMLSAQMTDKGVNKITPALFSVANTPEKMIDLGEEKLQKILKSINYYKTKSKHIIQASHMLITEFKNVFPETRELLEKLPGVGRKTANVILSVLFKHPTIAVDTHIFRVSNRTKLAIGKTPRQIEDQLMQTVPKKFLASAHHWLVLHGRYVCTARKPHCRQCMIQPFCEFEDKNL